ncbi:MAG TPA: aminopeptidase P N-terminal domain-containing protein [Bacteroidia bacterium]
MKIKIFFSLLLTLALSPAQAQKKVSLYDTDELSKEFHQGRREALRQRLPDSSMALFFAAPEKTRSNDVEYTYKQDPDFDYLTGLEESNSLLIIFKDMQDFDGMAVDEILFIQDKNPMEERWTGKRLGPDSAKAKLGFKLVKNSSEFADYTKINFAKFRTVMWDDKFHDVEDDADNRGDLASLLKHFKVKLEVTGTKVNKDDLKYIMAGLREVKLPDEIVLMRKVIKMSCDGHKEVMKALEPGYTEYQAQGIAEYIFKKNGSEFPGYPTISGGCENTCTLHYTTNRRKLQKGDLLLLDAGAEYHGYSADITRTIPVSGKFTNEQKLIYNIVLEAQKAGIAMCRQGNNFRDPHEAAQKVIEQKLMELGIIKDPKEAFRYFFHGTSHYLGLDVHDAGLYGHLAPGNIITVEPGIYIPAGSPCDPKWWNIGVRIEDDVLITSGDPEVLSAAAPKTVEEIESLMKQESVFNLIK